MPTPFRPPPSLRLPTLLLSAAFLAAACHREAPPAPPPPVVLVEPAAAHAGDGATYNGEIRARHEADLAFRVGGKIVARLVDAGAEIKAGQPLARLDPADLQAAADSARAQLGAAESDLATSRADRDRYADLLAKKFVSQAAFDAKENIFKAAQARLEQARSQNRIAGNQAAYGTLSSDAPGVVSAVLADAGQVVAAGQPVLRIARPEEKEIAVAVPEGRLAEFRAAKEMRVTLWAEPALSLRGVLRELSPAADPATRTYAARVRLIDPPPEVRLGMTARLQLGAGAAELRVPLSAVLDLGNGPFVRVVDDGKVRSRPIRIAALHEDGATIADGLRAGESVIISGGLKLVDGQAVEARPVTPPARQR